MEITRNEIQGTFKAFQISEGNFTMKRLKRRTEQIRRHTEQIKHNKLTQITKQGKTKVNTCIN